MLTLFLTHWGRLRQYPHICISRLDYALIGSDNGLTLIQCQANIWTNAGLFLIGTLGTNFSDSLIKIPIFSFRKIHFKMSSANWQPFCPGLNVLRLIVCDFFKKYQKALFRVLNELMHRNNNDGNEIANGIPCDDLAERLNHYFIEKIDHIRDHLVNTLNLTNIDHPVMVVPSSPLFSLSAFKHVTEKAVEKAVQSRPSKHCPLDPIPTWLLKNSTDILVPYLTELTNQSFSSGVFPYDLKTAILKPLLKKLGLDPENFKNLRPIINIAFLSKLLESLACEQYVDHLKKCNLAEMFQSAYREGHSVETALIRVHNDIMRAFDEKKSVILVLKSKSSQVKNHFIVIITWA